MSFPLFVFVTSSIATATVVASVLLSHRPALALAAGTAGAAALLLFIGPGYFNCFADDSYITFRYAQHLADGLGPTWNTGGRVEGYTSFSWMAILAGLIKLDADPVVSSQLLGFLSLLATFFFVERIWRLWSRIDPDRGMSSPVLPVIVFVGLALTDGTTFWGFSGLETPLFTATITGGVWLFLREREANALVPLSAVAFAAAALTRPEGLIAAAVTGAFALLLVQPSQDRQRAIARAALWAAVFIVLYGAYFLWRYTYYDHLFPNTYYAKSGASRALIERGFDYIWNTGLRYQLIALLAGAMFLLARPRLRIDALYVLSLSAVMLLAVIVEGGDAFDYGRFIMPLLPVLYLAGLAGFATVLRQVTFDSARTATGVTSVVLLLGAFSFYPGLHRQIPCRNSDEFNQREALGQWLSDNTPENYTVAGFAIGALGYYTDRDVLDLLGINDVTIAHTDIPDFGRGLAGHEKYNLDYVYDVARPEIIVPNDAEPGPQTTEQMRAAFSSPSPIAARNAYLTDPRLWDQYVARSLNVDGYWFNFLQRKDTVGDLQDRDLR